jgi:hypothetical protein
MALIRETWAMDRRPCFVLAAMIRAFPSAVLGPVLLSPCSWHHALFLRAGLRQADPRRVVAPHLAPGQWSPNRVLNPDLTRLLGLVLVSIWSTPFVEPCDEHNNIASSDPFNIVCLMSKGTRRCDQYQTSLGVDLWVGIEIGYETSRKYRFSADSLSAIPTIIAVLI